MPLVPGLGDSFGMNC